jgi:DNA-binding phage protein
MPPASASTSFALHLSNTRNEGRRFGAVNQELAMASQDFINAAIGFPELADKTGIRVKTLHQMFGPKGNLTAVKLFRIIACLQEHEEVKLQVVA